MYTDDYTLQLHIVLINEFEEDINDLLIQQAATIFGTRPKIICLDFIDIHYHDCLHHNAGELCWTVPRDGASQCYRYLARFALRRAKPLIVATTAVRGDEPKRDEIERLINHVAALPFEVALLLVDCGFYNEASIKQL